MTSLVKGNVRERGRQVERSLRQEAEEQIQSDGNDDVIKGHVALSRLSLSLRFKVFISSIISTSLNINTMAYKTTRLSSISNKTYLNSVIDFIFPNSPLKQK